jgi:hypothetical protein
MMNQDRWQYSVLGFAMGFDSDQKSTEEFMDDTRLFIEECLRRGRRWKPDDKHGYPKPLPKWMPPLIMERVTKKYPLCRGNLETIARVYDAIEHIIRAKAWRYHLETRRRQLEAMKEKKS